MIYKVIDFVFPEECVWCCQNHEYICAKCRQKLIAHQEFCNICHKESADFVVHSWCRDGVYYEWIIILWEFTSLVKRLIYKLKFWHRYHTVDFLAEKLWIGLQANCVLSKVAEKAKRAEIAEWGKSENIADIKKSNIYISYVPSHWWRRYWIKWYNQSELLACRLSEISWLPFVDIASKIKYTRSQVDLNRQQRLSNLVGSYKLWDNLTLSGSETIVIVDDISTTGSTINQLAKTIKYIYPDIKIWWLVIARSNK